MRSLATALLLTLAAVPLLASTYHVNTTADAADALPGNGICATAANVCSLRAAVQEANASASRDTVVLPPGTYALTRTGTNEDNGATGDLDIRAPLAILGSGTETTTISGAGADRIFDLFESFDLYSVTLRDGNAGAANGGAVRLNALRAATVVRLIDLVLTNNTGTEGGAVATTSTQARLEIVRTRFRSNQATVHGGALSSRGRIALHIDTSRFESNRAGQSGGAIHAGDSGYFAGIERSTFAANTAVGNGGAIYTDAYNGSLSLFQSTFARNRAVNGGAVYACCNSGPFGFLAGGFDFAVSSSLNTYSANVAAASGGAVYLATQFGSTSSTFVENVAPAGASAYAGYTGITTPHIVHSILASMTPNCAGEIHVAHSVVSDASCAASGSTGNLVSTAELLGPLADNGGPTLTHHPLPGSPVIDFSATAFVTLDQRGVPRPFGAGYDAGSVEVSTAARTATTITVSAFPNPSLVGEPVTLSVTAPNIAVGLVTFRNGSTVIGQAHLSRTAPATLLVASLAVGAHTITATYEGTPANAPSTSEPITILVVANADALSIPALDASSLAALALLLATFGAWVTRR